MTKLTLVVGAVIVLIVAMAHVVQADVPQLISFQGKLYDSAGNPLTGQYEVTFRLYGVESGGTHIWTETRSVDCDDGLYQVILGQMSSLNLDFDGQYWLGVQVTGDTELSPRYRLVSIPYAFRAEVADQVTWTGLTNVPEGFADGIDDVGEAGGVSQINAGPGIIVEGPVGPTVTVTADFGMGADKVAAGDHNHHEDYVNEGQANSVTSGMIVDGTIQEGDLSFTPGGDNDWTVNGGNVYRESGNVGIGTTIPSRKLTVDGGNAIIKGGDGWSVIDDKATLYLGDPNHGISSVYDRGVRIWTFDNPTHDIRFRGHTGIDYLTIKMDSGNVGIGTAYPTSKLEVSGTLNVVGFRTNDDEGIPNLICGYEGNSVASEIVGASITGGGTSGEINEIKGNYSVISGGAKNRIFPGYDFDPLSRYSNYSVISGGRGNTITSDPINPDDPGAYSVICGGRDNYVNSSYSSIGGGHENRNEGWASTIAGGHKNTITPDMTHATIGGGQENIAASYYSTVPGGYQNEARGYCSFAAGLRAKAHHDGTFVWADHTGGDFGSTGEDQFIIRASGGVGIGTNSPNYTLDVAGPANLNKGGTGAALRVNGAEAIWYNGTYFSWGYGGTLNYFADNVGINTSAPAYTLDVAGAAHASSFPTSSDARFKKNVSQLTDVLDKLVQIRGISFEWNEEYESLGRSTGHKEIGVIAQEVEAVFPELVTVWGNEDYKAVDYGRLAGIFIEAIKELNTENEVLKQRIEALETKLQE